MARQKEREAAKRPSSYPANQAQFHEATKLRAAYYRAGNCVNRRSRIVEPFSCDMPGKYTHLFLLNAWAEQTPLLGKGGEDAPSRNIPVPLKGAARSVSPVGRNIKNGVVRSNSKTISLERTTPSAPDLVASQHLFDGAATPPLPRSIQSCPAGQRQNTQETAPSKTKDLSAQFLERGLGFNPQVLGGEVFLRTLKNGRKSFDTRR